MNELFYIVSAGFVGIALGIVFYGGLWLTVKKGISAKRGGILFVMSFFLRTGITLVGFYFVSSGSWQLMLVCLGGFTFVRFVLIPILKKLSGISKEIVYEIKS